jgi:hypothetical protein
MGMGLPLSITPLLHYSITPLLHPPLPPDVPFPCWPRRCFLEIMNNIGHLPLSETARRVGKAKARRGRPRKSQENGVREPAAVGTLTRTKSLLLAALRVWELKHRISD